MGRATAQKVSPLHGRAREEAREPVPPEAYEDFDLDAFNARVDEYGHLLAEGGISAAFSHYAEQPVAVVYEPGRSA